MKRHCNRGAGNETRCGLSGNWRNGTVASRYDLSLMMTAFDDVMVRHVAPNLVHGIVRKPFDVPQLVAMVREVALTRMPDATASERDTNVGVVMIRTMNVHVCYS